MPSNEPSKVDLNAKSLIETYVDALPVLPLQESSRQYYEQLKEKQGHAVSVTHFNQVRFLAKFRQMEVEDDEDYITCFEEMRRFNRLTEELYRLRRN